MRPPDRPFKELFVGLACAGLGAAVLDSPMPWLGWFILAMGLLVAIPYAYYVIVGRRPGQMDPLVARIDHDAIEFSSYPFKHASIYGSAARIPAARITCRFDSITEVAFVIDAKEILFLDPEQKDDFAAFVARNAIATPKVTEVWMLITEPYLDQSHTEADDILREKRLAELGIPVAETKALQREVKGPMFARTVATWEWGLYSTYDVLWTFRRLAHLRFTRNFYWHVMEVALRPYALPATQPNASDQVRSH